MFLSKVNENGATTGIISQEKLIQWRKILSKTWKLFRLPTRFNKHPIIIVRVEEIILFVSNPEKNKVVSGFCNHL